MGSIRKVMASMLAMLALTAFVSDAGAQSRRSSDVKKSTPTRQSATRQSSTQSSRPERSSSVQNRKPNDNRQQVARPSAQSTKPSTKASTKPSTKPSSDNDRKPSTTVTRPSDRPSSPSTKPSQDNKPSQVTRPAPNRPQTDRPQANKPQADRPGAARPNEKPAMKPGKKPGNGPGKPVHVRPNHRPEPPRVHPRERDFMRWDRPSYYWSHNDHYYGYRVKVLPSHVLRHVYHGITYYCYNDIWYRPYGGYYVVCRPPYGLSLAANIISDIAWTAVRLSYYNTVANTYSQINENNAYIAEQNAVIAQNNATLAAQNSAILQNQQLAQASYAKANELGLIQSYAAAGSEYFYQDGVFYSKNAAEEYKVIIPPAGALVETLPDDFDVVRLSDGNEYYKVDDTIYKVVISEGKPYFEVVGQLYD